MNAATPNWKKAFLLVGLAALIGCPLSLVAGVTSAQSGPIAQVTIDFEPSIEPYSTERPPGDILGDSASLPAAAIEGDVLLFDGKQYPIGDEFYDAEGIPLGARNTDHTGLYGYASIAGLPSHVLIWYLEGTGRKRYLVTMADNPLMSGSLGFHQQIEDLNDAEDKLMTTAKTGSGALATAILLQLAVCPESTGASCVTAVATLLVGAVGATLWGGAQLVFELIPAMNNVERAFSEIDQSTP